MRYFKPFVAIVVVALGLVVTGCSEDDGQPNKPSTPTTPKTNTPTVNTPAPSGYPLTTCVVSGEKLGSMGDPYVINHNGVEVRLCCKSCESKFKAEPEKYLAIIKAGKVPQVPQVADPHAGHDHE